MAQVIIPTVIGIALSFAYSALNRSPDSNQITEGQKADTGIPKSEYGWDIKDFYGTYRINSCLLIWATELREQEVRTRRRQRSGGKGGGRRTTTTTQISYNYYLTAAFMIGGKITKLKRVWANSELIFSDEDGGDKSADFLEYTEIYYGTDDQNPSPTIESYKGAGNVHGYRNRSYIVFKDYPLALIGDGNIRQFPRIDVEVVGMDTGTENIQLREIIKDICLKSGLTESEIDVSDLPTEVVIGYSLSNNGNTYRQALEELQKIAFFIVREERDKIHFLKQKRDTGHVSAFLTLNVLGARKFGDNNIDNYLKKALNYQDVPSEVVIQYININNDHDTGITTAKSPTAIHYNQLSLNISVVEQDFRMNRVAAETLFELETQNETLEKMYLLPAWNGLKVGELFMIYDETKKYHNLYQITKKIRGVNYLIEIEANKYNAEIKNVACYPGQEDTLYNLKIEFIYPWSGQNYTINLYDQPGPIAGFEFTGETSTDGLGNVGSLYELTVNGVGALPQVWVWPGNTWNAYLKEQNTFFLYSRSVPVISSYIRADGLPDGDETCIDYKDFEIEINTDITFPDRRKKDTAKYGNAAPLPLDISLYGPSDSDLGIYMAVKADEYWQGGAIYMSEDNGATFDLVAGLYSRSVVAKCLSVLPSHSYALIDKTSALSIQITGFEDLDPVTEDVFLSGKNLALIGAEIVAFQNAVITSTNPLIYEISYFIRGLYGTEAQINNHQLNENFILLTDYIERLTDDVSSINRNFIFKAVANGKIETAVTDTVSITISGESIKPYPCLPVYGIRDDAGNLTINWFRRSRKNGGLIDYTDISYSEGELQSFTVEILSGNNVIRTFTVSDTSVVYSAVDQLFDFGALQSSISVRIYQNSSYPVGRKAALTHWI